MNTFGGYPLIDVRRLRDNRDRFRRDKLQDLERANSFYCPSGRWQSRGWVLLDRASYNEINKYSNSLQLSLGNLPVLQNISIVQAQCVTRGLASDENAIYLVELTDDRGILYNKWFQYPLTSYFNIRSPAYEQNFYSNSLNSQVPWTWTTMLNAIWNQMTGVVGALNSWPGLPYQPTGTPEGFWFPGVSAWIALNDILDYLGMGIACDLTQVNPFTIVDLGALDTVFSAKSTTYLTNKEDDLEWIDIGAARVPAQVKVIFKRRNDFYGSEETVRGDNLQWTMNPVYTVTVNAPAGFSGSVGLAYIWCDFTVRQDQSGTALSADTAVAATIAAERATQYYNKIYRHTLGYMSHVYAGLLPFSTGSRVDGVRWYQDYNSQDRQGWKTQIVRGAYPPWPGLWEDY